MTNKERIKVDAEAYAKSHGRKKHGYYALNYIAGATAEHDRAQVLTDRLGIALENIYNIHSHLWSEFDRKEITSILEQWKSGRGKDEPKPVASNCGMCGKLGKNQYLGNQLYLCDECFEDYEKGKEVGDA